MPGSWPKHTAAWVSVALTLSTGAGLSLLLSERGGLTVLALAELCFLAAAVIAGLLIRHKRAFSRPQRRIRRAQYVGCGIGAIVMFFSPLALTQYSWRETTPTDLSRNTALFERYPNEWGLPYGCCAQILPGTVFRNSYRADGTYRISINAAHWNPGVVYSPGAHLFLSFYGPFEISRVQGDEPDLLLWTKTDSRTGYQQWQATLDDEIRASRPPRVTVQGVNQSLFIKAPVPPGRYRVEYSFNASTAESTRRSIALDGHYFVEIYCPAGARCS